MAEGGEYNLIIEKVTASNPADPAQRLARAFGLDPQLTMAMLKTTPLIFATQLTKHEVKALTPKLADLSKAGLEFRITGKEAKIPKINWLIRPTFTAANSGQNQIAFDWQNTAFVCPSCGETYVFLPAGKLPLAESTAVSAPTPLPAPPPEEAVKPPTSRIPPAKPPAPPRPAAPPKVKLNLPPPEPEVPELAPLQLEEPPSLDLSATPAPVPKPDEGPAGLEDVDLVEPLPDDPNEQSATGTDIQVPDLSGSEPTSLTDKLEAGLQSPAAAKPKAAKIPPPEADLYNVFVPEVKDAQRKEDVVKLVSEVRGIPVDEARKLSQRLMIPVAKGVTKNQAEAILARFKKFRLTGRMTRIAPGSTGDTQTFQV
jgi:ribosomal protein L7/L12